MDVSLMQGPYLGLSSPAIKQIHISNPLQLYIGVYTIKRSVVLLTDLFVNSYIVKSDYLIQD
jgi:hypothetical protein